MDKNTHQYVRSLAICNNFAKSFFQYLLLALAFLIFLLPQLASAESKVLGVSGLNTVAGYTSLITTSIIDPGVNVEFEVTKPNGEVISFEKETDMNGIAQAELYDVHTRQTGVYHVLAKAYAYESVSGMFLVTPDAASSEKSEVRASKQLVKLREPVSVTIKLRDQYGNPIVGHAIKVVSSRQEDQIDYPSGHDLTDEQGLLLVQARSFKVGTSVYSVVDITTGETLDPRTEIKFYDSLGMEGQSLTSEVYAAGLPAKIMIEGLPSEVKTGTPISPVIKIRDIDGDLVDDYEGTIVFETSDLQATIPSPYTFSLVDAGVKSFELGVTLAVPGKQKIKVKDQKNDDLVAEATVNVLPASGVGTVDILKPRIDEPENDSLTKEGSLTVRGITSPNIQVTIFDDDIIVGTVQSDANGIFRYKVMDLIDGTHDFAAAATDAADNVIKSDVVRVIVDTGDPILYDVIVTPEKPRPGEDVIILIRSERDLQNIALELEGEGYPLVQLQDEDAKDFYETTIQAPNIAGDYPVRIGLIDRVGNRIEFDDRLTLSVMGDSVLPEVEEAPKKAPTDEELKRAAAELKEGDFDLSHELNAGMILFSWEDQEKEGAVSYNLYMSDLPDAGYTIVNEQPIEDIRFLMDPAPEGVAYFGLEAVNDDGDGFSYSSAIQVLPSEEDTGSDGKEELVDPDPASDNVLPGDSSDNEGSIEDAFGEAPKDALDSREDAFSDRTDVRSGAFEPFAGFESGSDRRVDLEIPEEEDSEMVESGPELYLIYFLALIWSFALATWVVNKRKASDSV